jgi:hypothetical protein
MATMNGKKPATSGRKRAMSGRNGATSGQQGQTNSRRYRVTGLLARTSPSDFEACARARLDPDDLVALALVLHVALDWVNELAPRCGWGTGPAHYLVGTVDEKDVTIQAMLITALKGLNAPLPVSAIQHDHDRGGDFS